MRSLHLPASKPRPAHLPVFLPFLLLAKDSCGYTKPTQNIQNLSPYLNRLGILIISAEPLLPCNIFTVLRVRLWHLPGGAYVRRQHTYTIWQTYIRYGIYVPCSCLCSLHQGGVLRIRNGPHNVPLLSCFPQTTLGGPSPLF